MKKQSNQNKFKYETDQYNSIHFKMAQRVDSEQFYNQVGELLEREQVNNLNLHYTQQRNAIWIHLQSQNFCLVSTLINKKGFQIHHAINQSIVLKKWICTLQDVIPPYSMFYISCGALLIRENQVFLVQEKTGGRKGKYGIPGGRADFGQCLFSCAQRQLFQQTGIRADSSYILHFRELSNTVFGGNDIYFVCVMKFKDEELKNIKLCERQLSDYKWVGLKEYEDFAVENCCGTQLKIAKYIKRLFDEGHEFKKKANEMIEKDYGEGKSAKKFYEHRLVNDN